MDRVHVRGTGRLEDGGGGAGCYRRYIGEGEAGGGERREIRSDEKN